MLIGAYACEPGRGSEPGVGWEVARSLSRFADVWVVTRANNREAIEAALVKSPEPRLRFVYHDLPRLLPLKRLPGGLYLYHYLWQLSLFSAVQSLHREVSFDIAHQLTFGSFRYPGSLHRLGIPFVIGPVGGGEEAPRFLWSSFGWRGFSTEILRSLSNRFAMFDPFLRATYDSASVALTTSTETAMRVQRLMRANGTINILPSIGITPEEVPQGEARREEPDDGPIRVLFVGRLVHWKGAHLAIRAFAEARSRMPSMTLTVLGSGPFERRIQALIRTLDLTDSVTLIGRLQDREAALKQYSAHEIFLFPSLHEAGGMAVIEAMSSGLPVVCLNLGGPGLAVQHDSGIKVEPHTEAQVVQDLASALLQLSADHSLRVRMGQQAKKRVQQYYTWSSKAQELLSIYHGLAVDSRQ